MLLDVGLFVIAAAVVWQTGTRITRYAHEISRRSGLGPAVIGLLLLGGITSLPEVGTSITAAARANAALAVNNVLGGVALQVVVLAIADAVYGKGALTAVVAHPNVLLLAALDIVLLTLVASGIAVGDVELWRFGLWSAVVAIAYCGSIWLVSSFRQRQSWIPGPGGARVGKENGPESLARALSNRALALRTTAAGAVILGAGYVLATRGEAIAAASGLGSSLIGAVLVALATSLPEISTAVEAVRLRQHELAFADIFGTNLFDLALIFLIDLIYAGPPVLNEVGPFSLFAALLGILLTAIYLAGLIERQDRAVLRMGIDSLVVIVLYVAGLLLLYQLRP